MNKYLNSGIGRLRLVAFLEGSSLVLLVFVAMPFKYILEEPLLVEWIGMIHGVLFVFFMIAMTMEATEKEWKFKTILSVFLSSIIPFGTFYIDRKLLRGMHTAV